MTAPVTPLDYAALGWSVFPCKPKTKEPATGRGGFHHATTNPATIRRWWLANPDYNIGVATGVASGVWVLDADGDLGATALAALEAEHRELTPTLTSTSSNGTHFWFRCPGPIQSSADRVGRCIDVRGDGGYALAPPSVHPDGPVYTWRNARQPAPAPAWLLELTRKPQPSISQRALNNLGARAALSGRLEGHGEAYGQAALAAEIDALANTPAGGRNHALNRASFALYQLVAGGELDGAEVRHRLLEAATANGLMSDPDDGPTAVARTIASGRRAGMQHPRNRGGAS